MRLSDESDYQRAVPAALAGNFDVAREAFERLIVKAREQGDTHSLCYLLQSLGDVEARTGNTMLAISLHEEAISLDPTSPLPMLLYAKGLFRSFGNSAEALAKLASCELLLKSYSVTEDELQPEWYEKEINELKGAISRGKT